MIIMMFNCSKSYIKHYSQDQWPGNISCPKPGSYLKRWVPERVSRHGSVLAIASPPVVATRRRQSGIKSVLQKYTFCPRPCLPKNTRELRVFSSRRSCRVDP
ncbi:Hypothetical_protein [Hexamita inflata]|uniref:Hypothetical_protein n=1 Tax=Hexamita inflata TaxID=28002 RepID=A0AA86QYH8_9EUKA|nr:Hypothetical protein HINF_LOCUS49659 [Hexamita inflata]